MEAIAKEFGLDLNGTWNKLALPHLGRHPNAYHKFVLQGMQNAKAGAGGSQESIFILQIIPNIQDKSQQVIQ